MLSGESFQNSADNAAKHESLVSFFHGFQVAATGIVMTNIVQFGMWTCWYKRKNIAKAIRDARDRAPESSRWIFANPHWAQYWPTYVLLAACILVNTQPMLILIIGSWHPDHATCLKTPNDWPCKNIFWDIHATNSFFPNQASGWMIQIFCTWGGYILLFIGAVQATGMWEKLKKQWREARQEQARDPNITAADQGIAESAH